MKFLFFLIGIVSAIAGIGFYLGRKVKNILDKKNINIPKYIFWLSFFTAIAVIIYTKTLLVGLIIYSAMIFAVTDIIKLILKKVLKEGKFRNILIKIYQNGITVIIIALVLSVYSFYCACVPTNTDYYVKINKSTDNIKIVMISDSHFGTALTENDLNKMVETVNAYSPDIICLCGDIFDESTSVELINKASEAIGKFKSKYGVYYIDGNHDKNAKINYIELFRANNIIILQDETVLINDSFYLIGRKDASVSYSGGTRESIASLMNGVDTSKPIILLDHQPTDTQSAKLAGIDLQLSGHTHGGQIWPIHYISAAVNDVNYGLVTDGNYNVIVGAGYGTWGFPLRLGSRAELVYIEVSGK